MTLFPATASPSTYSGRRYMRLPAVTAATGFGKSTIYWKISKGQFPKPMKLGTKAVGWCADEIAEWAASRERASFAHAA